MLTLNPRMGFIAIFMLMQSLAFSQNNESVQSNDVPRNHFRMNLTSLALRNYNFQYERVLSKRISLVLGYRTMPNGALPFKSNIISTSNDPNNALGSFQMSNTALTPELRIYAGSKGYGRGFYVAPYYRLTNFKASGVKINFTYDAGNPATMDLTGDLKANSFGLMIGAQWSLAKNISLDWHILGAHYGNSDGALSGVASRTHSTTEQANILTKLKEINFPLINETYMVTANGARMDFNGPWGGLRAGVSLGFKF